jgi:hypothetical protein
MINQENGGRTIRIGIGAPLSGNASILGREMTQAIQIAIDEVNSDGGIAGTFIESRILDDKGSESGGLKVANAFASDEKLLAVIGHYNSDVTLCAAPMASHDCGARPNVFDESETVLSGDTRQHGAVEASDALLAIERHSGVRPIELHKIRRQDPARGRDKKERAHINRYRKAVEVAAAGKLSESFERLDKMGAVISCGLGGQQQSFIGLPAPRQKRGVLQNSDAIFRLIQKCLNQSLVGRLWHRFLANGSSRRQMAHLQSLPGIRHRPSMSKPRLNRWP